MSDNVQQVFGIDASGALAAIARLDSAFASFEQRVGSLSGALSRFNSSSTASAAKQLAPAFSSANTESARLTTSVQLLSRIVFTQQIISGLRQIKSAFSDAIQSAIAFQTRVEEVMTISGGQLGSSQAIANSVRSLSDQFAAPLEDVTKALYQSISFGLKQPEEFLQTASLFAKGSVTSIADSVKLIGGTLNSFGLSTSEAGEIASKFFTIISTGAVTGSQLAQSFGQVAPLAHEAGISFDELGAAFATITQRGVSAQIAATQIRGVITGLLKPTADLSEALHKVGFSDASQALSTAGLAGTLKQVIATTDGTAESLAKLFPNIRGISGVLSLAGENASGFAEKLTAISNVPSNLAASKGLEILGTDAQRTQQEIQRLHNALTVDLGQSLLGTVRSVADATGGVSSFLQVVEESGPAILGITGGIIGLKLAATATNAELLGVGSALSALALIPVAAGLGSSLGHLIDDKLSANAISGLKDLEDANQKDLQSFKDAEDKKLKAAKDIDTSRLASTLLLVQGLNTAYLSDVANAKQANSLLLENEKKTADDIVKARSRYAAALGRGAETARESGQAAGARATDLERQKSDNQFNSGIAKESDADRVASTFARARKEAQQASTALTAAAKKGDAFATGQAENLFAHSQQQAQQAQELAGQTKDPNVEAQAKQQVNGLLSQQIVAERAVQAIQKSRGAGLIKEQENQTNIVAKLRDQTAILLKNSSLFDSKGAKLPDDQLAKQTKAREAALAQIAKLGFSQKDISSADALGLTKFVTQSQFALQKEPIKLQFDVTDGLKKITAQLDAAFSKFTGKVNIAPLEQELGRKFQNPAQVTAGVEQLKNRAAAIRQVISEAATGDQAVAKLKSEFDSLRQSIDAPGRQANRNLFGGDQGQQLRAGFNAALETLDKLRSKANLTKDDVQGIFKQFNSLNQQAQQSPQGRQGFGQSLSLVGQAIQKLNSVQAKTVTVDPKLVPELTRIQSVISQVSGSGIAAQFSAAASAIGQGVAPSNKIANAWETAADAAERLARVSENLSGGAERAPQTQARSFGGTILPSYFNNGGSAAKGIDTIPAMLAPGETVINQAASARFFSQLQAINAGEAPTGHAGTTINHNTVGDINISGAGNPKATAAAVVQEINRAQRRGSAKLK
ncbi:MAG TPA: phage tail tape measure protein [Pirellulales bacterium]|jgi:TP901 family phage tail tape measure protein|nr:phage tail tape measure protein [Pirellulales bacterium]